jgi:hypothetical protein
MVNIFLTLLTLNSGLRCSILLKGGEGYGSD